LARRHKVPAEAEAFFTRVIRTRQSSIWRVWPLGQFGERVTPGAFVILLREPTFRPAPGRLPPRAMV
jgi:hypothetical protein